MNINAPKKPSTDREYGDFWTRLLAVLLDSIIMVPISLSVLAMFGTGNLIGAIAGFAVSGIYYSEFLCGGWQATPGKRLLGLQVINENTGGALSRREGWLRYLAYQMPSLPFYSQSLSGGPGELLVIAMALIWFIPVFTDPERAGMHDKLASTRVIRGRAE